MWRMGVRRRILAVLATVLAVSTVLVAAPTAHASSLDDARLQATGELVTALEAFAEENGTYHLQGAGAIGDGRGLLLEDGGTYPQSMYDLLVDGGYLSADNAFSDPAVPTDSKYSIYRCAGRIGVFSAANDIAPAVEAAAWWADNDCASAPITNRNHTYFQLATELASFDEEALREQAVTDLVTALETFGSQTGTYHLVGGGKYGDGRDYYQYDGTNYPASNLSVLVAAGVIDAANPPVDPLDVLARTHSSDDFSIYRCRGRIAVFARSEVLTPSSGDAAWWSDNGCTNSAISQRNQTYFQIADELAGYDEEAMRDGAMATLMDALESYGAAEDLGFWQSHFNFDGVDHELGAFVHDDFDAAPSVVEQLINGGHLDASATSTDPRDVLSGRHSDDDFMIFGCQDRIGLFASSATQTTSVYATNWWDTNGCTDAPFAQNHGYFVLSHPVTPDLCFGAMPTVDLAAGDVPTDSHDIIMGTNGPDLIRARKGNDVICAMGGDDVIYGGKGRDMVDVGGGQDEFYGTHGHDVAWVLPENDDLVRPASDQDLYDGGARETPDVQRVFLGIGPNAHTYIAAAEFDHLAGQDGWELPSADPRTWGIARLM